MYIYMYIMYFLALFTLNARSLLFFIKYSLMTKHVQTQADSEQKSVEYWFHHFLAEYI